MLASVVHNGANVGKKCDGTTIQYGVAKCDECLSCPSGAPRRKLSLLGP